LANTLSALVWLPLMLAPGFFTARGVGALQNGQQTGLIIGTAASVLLGGGLLVAFMRKRRPDGMRAQRRR
jgi:membrane protein DedA with SNARE-associated domain